MNINIVKTYVNENKDAPQKGFQPIVNGWPSAVLSQYIYGHREKIGP